MSHSSSLCSIPSPHTCSTRFNSRVRQYMVELFMDVLSLSMEQLDHSNFMFSSVLKCKTKHDLRNQIKNVVSKLYGVHAAIIIFVFVLYCTVNGNN